MGVYPKMMIRPLERLRGVTHRVVVGKSMEQLRHVLMLVNNHVIPLLAPFWPMSRMALNIKLVGNPAWTI